MLLPADNRSGMTFLLGQPEVLHDYKIWHIHTHQMCFCMFNSGARSVVLSMRACAVLFFISFDHVADSLLNCCYCNILHVIFATYVHTYTCTYMFSFSLSYSCSSIPGRNEPQAATAGTSREQVPETVYPIPVPFRDRSEGIHCCEWWTQPRVAVLEHWPPYEDVCPFSLSRFQRSTFRVGGPGASLLQ